jgi:hypothetical protein
MAKRRGGRLSRRGLVYLLTVIGAVLALISYVTSDRAPWWSSFVGNVSVSVLILAPLVYVTMSLEESFKATREEVHAFEQSTQRKVEHLTSSISVTNEQLAKTMADVSAIISQRLADESTDLQKQIDSLRGPASREDVMAALRLGLDRRWISARGPRVDLPRTAHLLRFKPDFDEGRLTLAVEDFFGGAILDYVWEPGTSLPDACVELGHRIRHEAEWPGNAAYRPAESFTKLADLLTVGLDAEVTGSNDSISLVVQVPNEDWVITDVGMVSRQNPVYTIIKERFKEDWYRQMTGKSWVDPDRFGYAFDIAREVLGRAH